MASAVASLSGDTGGREDTGWGPVRRGRRQDEDGDWRRGQ